MIRDREEVGIMAALQVGQKAPDFRVLGVQQQEKQHFALSDYLGKKNVLIWFYVYDWTPL